MVNYIEKKKTKAEGCIAILDVKIIFITLKTLNQNKKADQLREQYLKIYVINELGSHIMLLATIDLHFLFPFW